jgi:hypothetical protein
MGRYGKDIGEGKQPASLRSVLLTIGMMAIPNQMSRIANQHNRIIIKAAEGS